MTSIYFPVKPVSDVAPEGLWPGIQPDTTAAAASRVWLVTFSDLVLLLLTFLVLLFAMSEVDLGRYGALSRSAGATMAQPVIEETQTPSLDFAIQPQDRRAGEDLGYLKAVITDALSRDQRFGQVATKTTEEYLVLSLPGSLLFEPGAAALDANARAAIFDIAGLLSALDNAIAVTGHVGVANALDEPFLTVWELSLARAIIVSEGLKGAGFDGPLTVLGQGDADYISRSQNLPEPARAALVQAADRVDIVIFPHRSGL